MSHIIFEQMENAGYLRHGKPVKAAVRRASIVDIMDFAQESCELTSAMGLSRDDSLITHSASLSLSCARWPCSSLECRLERAEQIAQFAALYSDRVYIRNLFSDYNSHSSTGRSPDECEVQVAFFEDLKILAFLRPLIEAGQLIPVTPPAYCMHCLAKHSLGLKDDRRLKRALQAITRKLESGMNVTLHHREPDFYGIRATASADLLDHGFASYSMRTPPRGLKEMPRLFATLHKEHKVRLSKWALHRIGFAKNVAGFHRVSILFELAMAQCLGTSFLSEAPLHIDFLRSLAPSQSRFERDMLIEKHLSCLVPFLKELSPSEILTLRAREPEAFVLFRAALVQAVEEYRKDYSQFRAADARLLYSDIISPKLAELEIKVKKARRALIKGTGRKVIAWTAAISVGLYSGLLPQGIEAAATALGLTKVLADLAEGAMSRSDTVENIKGHDMYLLWRLKQKADTR